MSVLFIAIPIALLVALIAIVAFVTQVRNGQYDDLETPAQRMLFDDEPTRNGEPAKSSISSNQNTDNF